MQECIKKNVSTETKLRFHVFQDERFVDLNLYQYGWERTEPLHSYGPYARNHYLFHYVISGKGLLLANGQEYAIEGGHGFLITPGEVTTYRADEQEPWEYTWIEFDGLRAHEALNLAGISGQNPVYSPASTKAGQLLQEQICLSFFRHIKAPHLSDRILSDKWGAVHSGAHSVFCLRLIF